MALQSFSPLLCLFLLGLVLFPMPMGGDRKVALPVPEALLRQQNKYFQAPADLEKKELLVLLSGLTERASHMNTSHLSRQGKIGAGPREQRPPAPPPPTREKASCKNFFWKTFSSC